MDEHIHLRCRVVTLFAYRKRRDRRGLEPRSVRKKRESSLQEHRGGRERKQKVLITISIMITTGKSATDPTQANTPTHYDHTRTQPWLHCGASARSTRVVHDAEATQSETMQWMMMEEERARFPVRQHFVLVRTRFVYQSSPLLFIGRRGETITSLVTSNLFSVPSDRDTLRFPR